MPEDAAKPRLLFFSINDGTDTRIAKEIKTLSQEFDITFLGIDPGENAHPFIAQYCQDMRLYKGQRRSMMTLLRYLVLTWVHVLGHRYQRLHIINEQLFFPFFPLVVLHRGVTLDLFDSMLLKVKMPHWARRIFAYLVFSNAQRVIVTDQNRKNLMPKRWQHKISVVPNYPYRYRGEQRPKAAGQDNLLLYYTGTLGEHRGSRHLLKMLETCPFVQVWTAGWVRDTPTEELNQHPRCTYQGIVPQEESLSLTSAADYILCLYEPNSINNINASPNKIYDAIQVETPVLINSKIKVAQFVEEQGLGYVMEDFYNYDPQQLAQALLEHKNKYSFNQALKERYTWEKVEVELLSNHKIDSQPKND